MIARADPIISILSIHYILKLIQLGVPNREDVCVYAPYAVLHWHEHLQGHEDEKANVTAQAAFFDSAFLAAHADVCGKCFHTSTSESIIFPPISGLHVCAAHDLARVAATLLSWGISPSMQTGEGKKPIFYRSISQIDNNASRAYTIAPSCTRGA
jgi:hypothetical protein